MIRKRILSTINTHTLIRDLSRHLLPGIVILLACASNIHSAAGDPLRYRGGMRNSPGPHKLNQQQLDAVLKSLRDKTGFREMSFDGNGFLKLGDPTNYIGGSEAARSLILLAVGSEKAIDLESEDRSPAVAFARLSSPVIYQSRATNDKIEVFPLVIDFTDFPKLRGDKKVLAAFDIGFVILHELGHAVLSLRDNIDDSEGPGECEEFVNSIRRELNLPERQNYIARAYKVGLMNSQGQIERAELFFAHSGVKPQKYSLSWEAQLVGPIRRGPLPSTKPLSVSVGGQ